MKNKQYKNYFSRQAVIRVETNNEEERSIDGVIATEDPVLVFDWYRFEPVMEVLLMGGVKIPKRIPLLDAHSRYSTTDVKGSVVDIKLDGDKLVGRNMFSTTAEKEYTLAKEGHLTDTSIGYRISPDDTVEIAPKESKEINGKTYKNDSEYRMLIRQKWTLKENSLVPIGADERAKLRSQFTEPKEEIKDEGSKVARSMKMNLFIHKHLKNLLK